MSVSLYDQNQTGAFPGMKGDSMNDNVETWACGNVPIEFGVVCSFDPPHTGIIRPGDGVYYAGISLHDHLVNSRGIYLEAYTVNIMTRGRVWAKVHSSATDNGVVIHGPAYFHPVTGEIRDAVTFPSLPGATIRSQLRVVRPVMEGPEARVVLVELHYPFFTNVLVP